MSKDENSDHAGFELNELRSFLSLNASIQLNINIKILRIIMKISKGEKPSSEQIDELLEKIELQNSNLDELMGTAEGLIE